MAQLFCDSFCGPLPSPPHEGLFLLDLPSQTRRRRCGPIRIAFLLRACHALVRQRSRALTLARIRLIHAPTNRQTGIAPSQSRGLPLSRRVRSRPCPRCPQHRATPRETRKTPPCRSNPPNNRAAHPYRFSPCSSPPTSSIALSAPALIRPPAKSAQKQSAFQRNQHLTGTRRLEVGHITLRPQSVTAPPASATSLHNIPRCIEEAFEYAA